MVESLSKENTRRIGADIRKVQMEWPLGMPYVRPIGGGLFELRSNLQDGIARVFFSVKEGKMILFHGIIKKTQKTPYQELELANKRKRDYEKNS